MRSSQAADTERESCWTEPESVIMFSHSGMEVLPLLLHCKHSYYP